MANPGSPMDFCFQQEWMQGHSVIENWDTTLEDRTRMLVAVASNYRQHLQREPVMVEQFEKLLSQSAMHA